MKRHIGAALLLIGGGYLAAVGLTAAAIIYFLMGLVFQTVGGDVTANQIVARVGAVAPLVGLTVLLALALLVVGLVLGGVPPWAGRGSVTRR